MNTIIQRFTFIQCILSFCSFQIYCYVKLQTFKKKYFHIIVKGNVNFNKKFYGKYKEKIDHHKTLM